MVEKKSEKTTYYRIDNSNPQRVSLRSFGFSKDKEHIVLDIEYWVNTVEVQKEFLQHAEDPSKSTVMRKLVPKTMAKRKLSIPLMLIENGEDVYVKYLDLLDMIREVVIGVDNIEDDSSIYKQKCQALIDKDKEDERRAAEAQEVDRSLPEVHSPEASD